MTALPKTRRTKSQQAMKRHQIKAYAPTTVACPECQQMIPAHTACPYCGKYKGRTVVEK
jgi:large subunit ribosomal protein L32